MDAIDYLASSNYVIVNRSLMLEIGINEALLLGELASECKYWRDAGKSKDGWFFSTDENLAERLPFGERTIRTAIDRLKELGVIETKLMGMPAKRFFRIDVSAIHGWQNLHNQGCVKIANHKNKKEEYKSKNTSVADDVNQEDEDIIPKADITIPFIEVTIYDSDDDCKTITVKHQVAPKDWNKAVNKWRKDPSVKVMLPLKDTGETEQMTFRRIKKYNLRPQRTNAMGYDRSSGTQFKVNL